MANHHTSSADIGNIPTSIAMGPARQSAKASVLLLVLQFVCMWAAFFVLAPSINWPASLDEPPEIILPLILEQAGPVFAGYASYLIHALLLIPLAVFLMRALNMGPTIGLAAVMFGVLAGLAKTLGISRWLFLMPQLAQAYVDPTTSDATKAAIAVAYRTFNAYAGGVGELLGVALFAGVWTVLLSIRLIAKGARILGYAGIAAAVLLFATLLSVVGIELPALLTLSGILWQFWTVGLAVHLLRVR